MVDVYRVVEPQALGHTCRGPHGLTVREVLDRLCFADGDPLEGDLAVVDRPPVALPEGGRVHSRPALVSGGRHCAGPPEIVSPLEGLLDGTVGRDPSPSAGGRVGCSAALLVGWSQ
ncbi:hypothetical protein Q7C36_002867 [Tachysurus vachellii]|uniref:Uncharacterized protein n=1 Tax=Tachysurus vachellii TaxID=175792 RepID=A0AA88T5F4_TACVA|nr:hypothetical protein Q7C36_002867 [Tachysurus vachellii]